MTHRFPISPADDPNPILAATKASWLRKLISHWGSIGVLGFVGLLICLVAIVAAIFGDHWVDGAAPIGGASVSSTFAAPQHFKEREFDLGPVALDA